MNNGAYLTAANWTPSGPPGAADVAVFDTTTTGTYIGLNGNSTGNLGAHSEGVGEFNLALGSVSRIFGDSSTTSGSLTFAGVNGTYILNATSSSSFSFVPTIGSAGVTSLIFGGTAGTIEADNASAIAISTNITGGGSLTKAGTGSLTLSGTNAFGAGGTFAVAAGSVYANSATALGSSVLTVAGAGTIGGTGTITGAATVSGAITPGASASPAAATLSFAGGLTLNSSSSATFDLSSAGSDKIAVTGNLALPSAASTVTLNFNSLDSGAAFSTVLNQTINLITYSGSLTGSFGAFQVGTTNAPGADTFTLLNDANSVDLKITASATPRNLTWDPSGTAGTAVDGSGTWDTTSFHWLDPSGNVTMFSSIAPDNATFGTGSGAGSAYTATITPTGGVTAGSVTFSAGSPTYTVAGNTLTLASSLSGATAFGLVANTSAIVSAPVALAASQTWTAASGQTLNVSGGISGSYALTTGGAGVVALTSTANTYAGPTNVSGGTLQVVADGSLGAATAGLTLNGGTLQLLGYVTSTVRPVTIGTSGATIDTNGFGATFGGGITGTTATNLTKISAGDVTFDLPSNKTVGTVAVNGGSVTIDTTGSSNFYVQVGNTSLATGTALNVGTTSAHAATVEIINGESISGSGSLNVAPGSYLELYGTSAGTVGTVSTPIVANTGGGLNSVIGSYISADTLTVSGNITNPATGSGGVTFGGTSGTSSYLSGKVVLTGANTYTGGTLITAGTVVVNPSSGLGTGPVSIGVFANAAGTANSSTGVLAGTGAISAPITILAGGTITAGSGRLASDSVGVLTSTGTQTWNTGGIFTVKLVPTATATATPGDGSASGSTPGTFNDELVFSGLTSNSTGLTVNVVPVNTSTGSFASGSDYSFVIAHDLVATNPMNTAAFDGLLLSNITVTGAIGVDTVSSMADGTGGEYLLLDVAAPEPTSLVMLAIAGFPFVIGRRRRTRCGH